jgi:hypothetical protein
LHSWMGGKGACKPFSVSMLLTRHVPPAPQRPTTLPQHKPPLRNTPLALPLASVRRGDGQLVLDAGPHSVPLVVAAAPGARVPALRHRGAAAAATGQAAQAPLSGGHLYL